MSFIQVYIAKDEIDATLVKGFLESNGIDSIVNPLNSNEKDLEGLGAETRT